MTVTLDNMFVLLHIISYHEMLL